MMKFTRWLACFLALGLALPLHTDTPSANPRPADDAHAGETKAQRDQRMAWWRQAKFGMFIHWGIYSVPAGIYKGRPIGGPGEWIMHDAKIPVADYARFASRFNPVQFNAEEWVSLAQEAGIKYMVITAKHHDGFAMFPSAVGGFNIVQNSPFKRDPLAELAAACRKHGMKLGFYYSQNQDWHQSGGSAAGGHWDQAQDGSTDAYLQAVSLPQVKELLTHYGPGIPAVFWWDTPQDEMTPARAALFQPLLKLRPDLITNNRLSSGAEPGLGYPGDTETPEQHIPPQGYPGRDWETCMTINNTWGYKSGDTAWKSTASLIHNLVDITSKGGNYLLNVGPDSLGQIPEPEAQRLRELGAWLKVNGEAIYASQPWARSTEPGLGTSQDFRFSCQGGSLYAIALAWPFDGKILLKSLALPEAGLIKGVSLLGYQGHLNWKQGADGLAVALPLGNISPYGAVLKISGSSLKPADVDGLTVQVADATGSISLNAADAQLHGVQVTQELKDGQSNIGYWSNPQDWISWKLKFPRPGVYKISASYAAAAGAPDFSVEFGPEKALCQASDTGSWEQFRSVDLGQIKVGTSLKGQLCIRARQAGTWKPFNLRGIKLSYFKAL